MKRLRLGGCNFRAFKLVAFHAFWLLAVAAAFNPCLGSTPELIFEAGSRAYLDGDWAKALENWKQLESAGYRAGGLFFNIGNAYYKLGELGEAILYWEKAAKYMGGESDIAANLEIARARLADRLDQPVRLPVWNWLDRLRGHFPAGLIVWGAPVVCALIFVLCGLRRWVWSGYAERRRLGAAAWLIVVLLAADLALVALKARDDLSYRFGILLQPEVQVLSAPAEGTGKLLFTLHEGTRVQVLRELEGWYEVSAEKDKQGWVKRQALGVI